MNPREIVDRARERFSQVGIELSAVTLFVDDELVDYGMPHKIYVRSSDLFHLHDVARWKATVRNGAVWVHLNCLHSDPHCVVVSIRCGGTRESSQTPAVNVSVERLALQVEDDRIIYLYT